MENLSFMFVNNHNADNGECLRPLANFLPDIWEDRLTDFTPLNEVSERQTKQEIKTLKEQVRKELVAEDKDPKERLKYIDTIQRLGVAYHFEDEIEAILLNFYNMHFNDDCFNNDLHYVSLRFRVLRQHGFPVSSDVFDNLKNEDGSFKENDVEAMLSLYEASHLRVHGEDTLDATLAYTRARLAIFASDRKCRMVRQVIHALELPLFRRSPRLESTYQISYYGFESLRDDNLLKLAKLDFNVLQSFHKKELLDILRHIRRKLATSQILFMLVDKTKARWSKNLDFTRNLPYARDRMVESYVWLLGVYDEPKYSYARILCNKLFKLISIINDTYDAYGVVHELQLFTDAIQRWDKSCVSKLPDYMKFLYDVILSTCEEFAKDLAKEGRSFATDYYVLQMKALCRSYMKEAKWRHEKYVPTYDEYMKNGILSAGYICITTTVFLGMGSVANKDAFDWINEPAKVVQASCVLGRNLNDICTHKFEENRGHVATAVESYMKQFGVTQEEAYVKLRIVIENAWKDIIQDMFRPTPVPMTLLTRVLNLSRTLYDIYGTGEDGYTMNHFMKDQIEAVLKTPIS